MYSVMKSGRKGCWVRLRCGLRCALAAMIVAMGAARALAQCTEEQKLTASDADATDRFGQSVSVSGDTAVVGASFDDCAAGDNCGSAYVYRFNGTFWVEEQKLTASDAGAFDQFGFSVSVTGETAVVGASGGGSAYVFGFNGTSWVEEQKLTASDAAEDDEFGRSVSVSDDLAVIGAQQDDDAGLNSGSAYLFRFNGTSWIEEQKLTASDAAADDFFGGSVSVSGDKALVGARSDDCAASRNCGAAYVFRFNGTSWVQEQKLAAADAAVGDEFGLSVSLSGDTAVVGAFADDCAAGFDCGAAYVFRFNGTSWVEEQKLTASEAAADDQFGRAVSVSGETAVVGAASDHCAAGLDCGSAYVFRFNGTSWFEEQKLTASDAAALAWFGWSVSVTGETAVVGAFFDDCAAGPNCGSAYVFSYVSAPTVVNLDIKPGSCPNPVNPRSRGVVPVAIVGSLDFDVATVDLDSLTLTRADGVGGSVSPLSRRRGPGIAIEDVATPFVGEPCACHELDGDGMDDLSLKFSASEMSRAFGLNALARGETIELVLRGSLQDGTTFEAADCIVILGTEGVSNIRHRAKRPK